MNVLQGSRVAFLQNNAINESLGLCDLAGHLGALGVKTRLFLDREERRIEEDLHRFDPNLVVIPCDLLGHNTALQLARIAKKTTRAPTVLGGTHPTFFPDVVLQEGVDYGFAGEAEGVVADLLKAVLAKSDPSEIPNLIAKMGGRYRNNPLRPVLHDLDGLAMPDRDIYYRYPFIGAFPWKKFATGRGCLNSCGYCFNPSYRKLLGPPRGFFRRKSPARIIREILTVRKRYPISIAHFSDDLFSSGNEWLEPFIEAYRADVDIPFSCNVFASSIDEKTASLLKQGGCRVVAMGVEIADDHLRRSVMNKPVSTEQILHAARMIKRSGIHLVTFNILGLPWSSIDQDIDTLALNQEISSDHTRVAILVPFPKSAMTRRLIEEGYLAHDFDQRIYEVEDLPKWPAETLFRRTDPERTLRLYKLWPFFLRCRLSKRWMQRLVRSRLSFLLTPFGILISLLNEQKIFNIPWLQGFRYFLHVKSPSLKTTNYVTFI